MGQVGRRQFLLAVAAMLAAPRKGAGQARAERVRIAIFEDGQGARSRRSRDRLFIARSLGCRQMIVRLACAGQQRSEERRPLCPGNRRCPRGAECGKSMDPR